ncbi:MAG: aminotransferase class I/II-fold pyridoxal phosphate-dependent enzyme [Gammaproteobacteria bacterium]|nr:aminotransferase class I/II-fold pyridoxal phosphate-dependent enzyme [Gammaproteobacteria bacterium]
MFDSLNLLPPDAIIGLIAEYRNDPREPKVDLGIGVYRNAAGETPVLDVVKRAERRLVDTQLTKSYIGSAGPADFNEAMRDLTFAGTVANDRVAMLQTPGGSGSLRVAAGVILRARPDATIWASDPTWANHVPLLGGAGLDLQPYTYYDAEKKALNFDGMLESLREIPKGDIVLLHTCCHNPTGIDPDEAQWRAIADVLVERGLIPFVDVAYQGFAADLDADAFVIRELAGRVPEMIVANSCSKNFGLYRDRVGALFVVTGDSSARDAVQSQANNVVRTIYSMPPDHGAAVVAMILNDDTLRADWIEELTGMRERLREMRQLLHDALLEEAPGHDFSHLVRAKGMFCFLGLSPEQVSRLKKDHAVYMVDSSRINIAGISPDNVGHIARSVATVL